MAPITPNNRTTTTVHHFTHKGNPLVGVYNTTEFMCDGCKTTGNGKRYHCQKNCDFDLHLYCARCPEKLTSSFLHPEHEMVMSKPLPMHTCDICSYNVEGLFYRCSICDFDVHPLCTQMPRYVAHLLDSKHKLELKPPPPDNHCDICKRNFLKNWCYRCEVCSIDVHIGCISASPAQALQMQSQALRMQLTPMLPGFGEIPVLGEIPRLLVHALPHTPVDLNNRSVPPNHRRRVVLPLGAAALPGPVIPTYTDIPNNPGFRGFGPFGGPPY